MASVGTSRRDLSDDVVARLQDAPQCYNLFQAIWLIERAALGCVPLGKGDGRFEALRLGAITSMKFEPRDITSVEPADALRDRPLLRTPIMALAGAHGPLPEPFARRLFERASRRDYATHDFLDIFHHRLLTLLYRSKKRRFGALSALGDPDGPPLQAVLRAFMREGAFDVRHKGVASRNAVVAAHDDALRSVRVGASPQPEVAWLAHAGLLAGAPRSLRGLETLMQHRLGIRVDAQQFIGTWLPIDVGQRCRLRERDGRGARLDGRSALGRRAWDQSAGIGLRCRITGNAAMRDLLPGGRAHAVLVNMLQRYLPSRPFVQVTLQLLGESAAPARISTATARLGWTTRLMANPSRRGHAGAASLGTVRFSVMLSDSEMEKR